MGPKKGRYRVVCDLILNQLYFNISLSPHRPYCCAIFRVISVAIVAVVVVDVDVLADVVLAV